MASFRDWQMTGCEGEARLEAPAREKEGAFRTYKCFNRCAGAGLRRAAKDGRVPRQIPLCRVTLLRLCLQQLCAPSPGLVGFAPGFVEAHQLIQHINGVEVLWSELHLPPLKLLQE